MEEHELVYQDAANKEDEHAVIVLPNTVVDDWAMMVKFLHTPECEESQQLSM